MEKYQIEKREKIAAALVLAAAAGLALKARKDGKTGIARLYPGGSFFADVIKDAREEASTRLAFLIKSLNPPEFDFGGTEHADEELDEIVDVFELKDD